ncbi:hypothetical protein NDU88_004366 [Pleurodeles waltl]|uniref:Uncharacterized protein n=1 Tax=Pleurodeles waltl TaxID=8319 RepID=A0AAV7UFX7_PLEWA|nr:hypothetical protein NDU88_004366 [Pleurodeles waltl]
MHFSIPSSSPRPPGWISLLCPRAPQGQDHHPISAQPLFLTAGAAALRPTPDDSPLRGLVGTAAAAFGSTDPGREHSQSPLQAARLSPDPGALFSSQASGLVSPLSPTARPGPISAPPRQIFSYSHLRAEVRLTGAAEPQSRPFQVGCLGPGLRDRPTLPRSGSSVPLWPPSAGCLVRAQPVFFPVRLEGRSPFLSRPRWIQGDRRA